MRQGVAQPTTKPRKSLTGTKRLMSNSDFYFFLVGLIKEGKEKRKGG